jgi:O-methyltransferase involved in polyketide biosynthesis
MDGNKIHVPNPKASYLPTLYGKAVDAEEEHSILNDVWAAEAVKRLDFDFSRLPVVQGDAKITLPWRAKQLDGWVREFLTANPEATVLNLGCGLDTRVFRIDPPPTVHWYDVDFPEVIELRKQLYPVRHDYEVVASSATDPKWLEQVPKDRPVMVVGEGFVQYLTEDEAIEFFTRIVKGFPSGQFIFDAYSKSTVRIMRIGMRIMRSGAILPRWMDEAEDLSQRVPGLRLVSKVSFLTMPEMVPSLIHSKAQGWLYYHVFDKWKWYRDAMSHFRFEF